MKVNNGLVKATAAAALSIAGFATVNTVKPMSAHVQAATVRVKINYVPGYGINVWNNFNHGHFTGVRAKHGTTWNVLDTEFDHKGNKWYEIGENQWIMAKYTVNANKKVKAAQAPASQKSYKVASASTTTKKAATTQSNQNTNKPASQAPVVKAKKHRVRRSRQASGNASAVVALARSEAGKRYVWGATGPNSFDCSGLVQYVYSRAAGINVTRTTYSQVKQGRRVSLNALQPGDLLFWGSASAPYHVGIYLGNGQYIHAATPSQGVIIQSISRYFYPSTARRILG